MIMKITTDNLNGAQNLLHPDKSEVKIGVMKLQEDAVQDILELDLEALKREGIFYELEKYIAIM